MSELRSAVESLQAEDLRSVADEQLDQDFAELQAMSQALEAERLRRLAEIHRRQSHRREGYVSTASWLVDRHRLGWTAASREIRTARSLERMPHTKDALASGALTSSAVQMLVAARHAHPAQFHQAEPALVEAAKRLPATQLQHTMTHWRHKLDWEQGLEESERLREQRRLTVSTTILGMVRIDGELDPETGETVLTAIRDCLDADHRHRNPDDHRSATQRRVDAIGEICRRWLNVPGRPLTGGERPHIAVIVDLESLQARGVGRSDFEHAGPIHPEAARRLACDASISRVITRGDSEPLDVGRRTAVVPAPMRRALVVRDRHCRFPGCDRPPAWCDAHHVVHWANGGPTSASNLVLLCRRHHRMVHESRLFTLEMVEGQPVFRRRRDALLAHDGAEGADPRNRSVADDAGRSGPGPVPVPP